MMHQLRAPPSLRRASTTLALESAYDVQFAKGHIDTDALQPLIYDVLQARRLAG